MIIICGPNHSGTSHAAKVLLDNGFITNNYSKENAPNLNYVTYEDLKFREHCQRLLKREKIIGTKYLESLNGKKLFVKYPSVVLFLNNIVPYIRDDVKVVFCYRDFDDNVESFMKKTGKSRIYSSDHVLYALEAITKYNGSVYFNKFEIVLKDPSGLLEYCK